MVKPSETVVVWSAEEDMIQVKKLDNGYLYSFLSVKLVEYSTHLNTFADVE